MLQNHVPKILIVDDEPAILALLRLTFEHAGYDVQTAPDANEAKAAYDENEFDVVLSDVTMPGPSGHELAEWIAANHPSTRTLLMSGFDCNSGKYPETSHHKTVAKPFAARAIIAAVEDALRASG